MEYRVRITLASGAMVAAIALGVSLIVSVAVASWAYRDRSRHQDTQARTITVKGSARQHVTSDLCVWKIAVVGEAATLAQAFERLETGHSRVREFLKSAGFADAEVAHAAIRTETHYARDAKGNATRDVEGYTLARDVVITTGVVDRVMTAAGSITALLKDGVLVRSEAPEFLYSKLGDLKVSILGDASRDARARADEVARNAGSTVGEVRGATMGPLQVVQPNSTDVSSSGIYDTSTIQKDVTAVVTMTFAVDSR